MNRTRKRAFLVALVALATASSCGGTSNVEPRAGQTNAGSASPTKLAEPSGAQNVKKARWSVSDRLGWIERTDKGVDRLVVGSRRVETAGATVLGTATTPAEIDSAAALPPWATKPEATRRYVLWHERDVYSAATWLGEAVSIGRLPAPVIESFDWLDGTGLFTQAGIFVVRAQGGPPERLDLQGAVKALAVDDKRAVVLTVFGKTRLTLDGGANYRDISAEIPDPLSLEVRGDELHVLLPGEGRRVVLTSGKIEPRDAPTAPLRHEAPEDLDDRWPAKESSTPLENVVQFGVLLPDGDALTTEGDRCARVDLETGRATALFVLPTHEDRCEPFRAQEGQGPLLLCESQGHARVIDVTSGGRIERTFDIATDRSLDRFVGVDGEALGFVGPCEGDTPPSPADVVTGASPTNGSNQRSPVFCARKDPETWVEHKLEPADASDIVAWIPRPDGGAVAIVAVPGTFFKKGVPRVSVQGSLRVVRVSRNEPPLDISTYGWESGALIVHSLRSFADGSVEGWITSAHSPSGVMSVRIDAEGYARQNMVPPRATRISTAGRYALVSTEDNKLFQSTDFGKTFRPAVLPPSSPGSIEPSACTEVGCRVGAFVRLGWDTDEHSGDNVPVVAVPTPENKRQMPAPPLARLVCHFSGPGETKRLAESFALGVTPNVVPRMAPGRIGFTGALMIPWSGPQISPTGDADIAFVRPFDLAAPIIRQSVPLSRLGPNPFHPFEVHLGYLLDGSDLLSLVSSSYGRCAAPLVDESGLTVPTGGCVPDPTVGVVIGTRATLMHHAYGQEVISSMELPSKGRDKLQKKDGVVLPHAPHELVSRRLPEHAGDMLIAAGEREGKPVAVAINNAGQAVLVPVDPIHGNLGPEEPLASLHDLLAPKDPRCQKSPNDARVLLTFDTEIGLLEGSLPGISATGTAGIAVVRWSRAHACLEAVEIAIRDERHEQDLGYYDPPGTVRKIIAKLEGKDAGKASLIVLGYGSEVRQPVVCDGVVP